MRSRLSQKGDTIAEVMISCAVTALILTSAFILANHSVKSTRQAQERSEALNIAQGQLENFTNELITGGSIDLGGNAFCLQDGTALAPDVTFISHGPLLLPPDDPFYPLECRRQNLYGIAITRTDPALPNTYDITVSWPSINGDGYDDVVLTVRNYGN